MSKYGNEYGLRFGTPKDAEAISMMFKEIYDYKYAYPLIYDINYLRRELSKENNFWFVGELIDNKEIAGAGLLEKKRYIAHTSQAVVKKKFQGQGVTTKIGAAGIIKVLKMPQFKDILRVDSEVRGIKIGAQKLNQNAGAIPFSFIPSYINWGDKRDFKIDDNKPIPPIQEESAFFYCIIFRNLWNKREKEVYLLNNEDIIFFYNYVKKMSKKMNKDILLLENPRKNKGYELYGVSKDYYEGRVNLFGYIKEKSLNHLIKTYHNWRIIIWRIPTTRNGIYSMALAIRKGFKVVGYDIGFNNINWTLFDSVIFVIYPQGFQNLDVECLDKTKPLVNKIKELFSS
ncbi:MAG: hypothetical protein JSV23_11210 [Promethearchaeota archaeon]|nr:MAG: hypothetical protein JSV23_11210 [Candidatus Lokiarchaeota archaeon]